MSTRREFSNNVARGKGYLRSQEMGISDPDLIRTKTRVADPDQAGSDLDPGPVVTNLLKIAVHFRAKF